jgi:hypothetical protein
MEFFLILVGLAAFSIVLIQARAVMHTLRIVAEAAGYKHAASYESRMALWFVRILAGIGLAAFIVAAAALAMEAF